MKRMGFLILFLIFFSLYLYQASPSVTSGDSGEFMASAATLSLAHPPSYPLFSLCTRTFAELVPFGDFSYRSNVFSSLLSAGVVATIYLTLLEAGLSWGLSLLGAACLGFGWSFWMNSLITEVFPLNTFFASLILFCALRGQKELRFMDAGFLLLGIGLANHQILLVMGPILAWIAFRCWKHAVLSRIRLWIFLFLIGFSVNLYIPVRAHKDPPLNWGQPTNLSRVIRTLTRADYGSLSLAIGATPDRTAANTQTQLLRFIKQYNHEWPWPLTLLALAGLCFGVYRREPWAETALAGFILTGPIFFLLSNLPFTGQSEGVFGRFFILPSLFLVCGFAQFRKRWKIHMTVALLFGVLVLIHHGWAEACAHRTDTLVLDYGRSMLRTLPRGSSLYMDGGDDAFYSLAYLHEAKGLRPDLDLHDRGGLVYRNPYGADFRGLTKENKTLRRQDVERTVLGMRPLFYSSMDESALPGTPLHMAGFLMAAGPAVQPEISWDILILRSLYPPAVSDYRTRGLAVFFPYVKGRALLTEGRTEEGLQYWKRAADMGSDVDWFVTNISYDYAVRGFNSLQAGKLDASEKIYRSWLEFDPRSYQAHSNLGVVYEREGRIDEAVRLNELTSQLFPNEADPLYNNAVVLWRTKDWPRIARLLEGALARNPRHQAAAAALAKIPPEARR